jgi:hypothetical protein
MSKSTHKSIPESVLPSIVITTDEAYRLSALALQNARGHSKPRCHSTVGKIHRCHHWEST